MTAFIDARRINIDEQIHTDICIVGAGAAGLTLAESLKTASLQVLVLESGDLAMNGATQDLYSASQTGLPYYDLTSCRLRFFGGTTNHWGGYCTENDPIDYAGRPELNVPRWPLSYKDMAPYVALAARQLGLDPAGFDPRTQLKKNGLSPDVLLENRSSLLRTKVFQISRQVRFHEPYRQALTTQKNATVFLNANVIALQINRATNHVERALVKTLGPGRFSVAAKIFVLAAHAIETARLLLVSDDILPNGIGNEFDHVGRYFMEHPRVVSGLFFPNEKFPHFYSSDNAIRHGINVNLSFTEAAMRQHGILQYYCRFIPVYEYEKTMEAIGRISDGFWQPADMRLLKAMRRVFSNAPDAFSYLAARTGVFRPTPIAYRLDHRIEQAPNPNSRVRLISERDNLGVRKINLHWALSEIDYRTFAIGLDVVSRELRRLGMGRIRAEPLLPDIIESEAKGHYHHIGTARMSERAKDGVVDKNLKVHDISNLYVLGSAVFPTAGFSGPTMMVIALAIRLAEHLSYKMKF